MLNRLAEQLLSMLLSQFATPDKIREYADLLKRALYRAVDVLIAAIVTAILSYLNQPSDGVVLGVYGDTPAAAVGSATVVFTVVSLIRYLSPILLAIVKAWLGSSLGFLITGIITLLMFSCSQTLGASIEGPTQVQSGRLVKLTARVAADSKFAWFAFPPQDVDAVFVDKQFIFAANPGRYVVYLVEFPEGGGQSQTMSTVEVLPASPQPVPVPPQPGPAPSLPDGQFGLAKWAYAQAKLANDSANAQSLAGEVRAILSAVAAGTIKTPNDLQTSLRSSLDARGERWAPFRKALRDELIRLGMGSKTLADWVTAFGEVATGLEAVR